MFIIKKTKKKKKYYISFRYLFSRYYQRNKKNKFFYKWVYDKRLRRRARWKFRRRTFYRTFKKAIKLKNKKILDRIAKLYIKSKRRNTFFTLTGKKGRVICKSSAGLVNFKGTKRKTPMAAREAARFISKKFPKKFYKLIYVKITTRAGVKMRYACRGLISKNPFPMIFFYVKKRPHSKGLRGRKRRRL